MVLEVVGSWGFVAEILLKTKNLQTTFFIRLAQKEEEEDEYMFHLGSYWWFRRIQCIPRFGEFYKNVGNLLGGLTD